MRLDTMDLSTLVHTAVAKALLPACYLLLVAGLYWAAQPPLPWWRFFTAVSCAVCVLHLTIASAVRAAR